jgi:hypothetical protein
VQETSKAKGGELLIDSTVDQKGEMGNKVSEGGQKIKSQDKIPSESPLGKILKYWDDSPVLKGKRNKEWLNTVVLSGPKNRS